MACRDRGEPLPRGPTRCGHRSRSAPFRRRALGGDEPRFSPTRPPTPHMRQTPADVAARSTSRASPGPPRRPERRAFAASYRAGNREKDVKGTYGRTRRRPTREAPWWMWSPAPRTSRVALRRRSRALRRCDDDLIFAGDATAKLLPNAPANVADGGRCANLRDNRRWPMSPGCHLAA
jgi:hypothetical protein